MRLYDFEYSGNCYKVRLFLALIGQEAERVAVDPMRGATRAAAFRTVSPRGKIPVLADGPVTLWDSTAILVYLARRYAGPGWLPDDPVAEAQVMQWLAVAQNELLYGLARARLTRRFELGFDLEACQAEGRQGLEVLEQALGERPWLVDEPTLADIACYPYVGLAPEAGIELGPYPGIRAWLSRIEGLPGYIPMPGLERSD